VDALGLSGHLSADPAFCSRRGRRIGASVDVRKAPANMQGPLRWRDGYIDNGRFIKATWRTIEADNGAVTAIGMKSIVHDAGGHGANAVAYVVEGDIFDPSNLRGFTFDCHGHFSVLSAAGLSPMVYAPPRSVAAQIGALACAGAPIVCDVARQNGMTCN
jgi:hypothetical protein